MEQVIKRYKDTLVALDTEIMERCRIASENLRALVNDFEDTGNKIRSEKMKRIIENR
jgi:hypothetical protein